MGGVGGKVEGDKERKEETGATGQSRSRGERAWERQHLGDEIKDSR